MIEKKNKKKLRIRSDKELSERMEGLIQLKKVLEATLDKWFLSGGTLLGAYRDGDFIPWDWDVEVTVLTEEAQKKEAKLLNSLINAGFLIASFDSSFENFKIVALGWGTEYEILGRYFRVSDDSRVRLTTKVPSQLFKNSEIVTFRNHDFPAPSPVSQFLESLYGDWKKPLKSANKKNYFSKDAFIKKKRSWLDTQLIDKIYKLLYPKEVQEFPVVKNNDLNIFKSWDNELGWCNQPNSTKIDKSDFFDNLNKKKSTGLVVINTDNKSSRICSNPSKISDISFYGDGFCMCRNVHDSQTFSWYLGKLRKTRVSNYGVNNYGLDQSLLLLRRNYLKDASNTVVLAHSSSTMANCSSVYGHYLEPKSILAIKPRFKVKKNHNELEYIKYPFISKQNLMILNKYKNFFRSHDPHFSLWKKNKFKYFTSLLPRQIASRIGIKLALKNNTQFKYKLSFWQVEEDLFLGLMAFFSKLSEQYGFKPVFLLQHNLESLQYLKNKKNEQLAWSSAINKAKKNFSKIKFLDEAEIFINYNQPEKFYSKPYHSPIANHMIADYLNKNL